MPSEGETETGRGKREGQETVRLGSIEDGGESLSERKG